VSALPATTDGQTVEPRRLTLGGGSISYFSAGSGPPLLFLHGGGGAGRWQPAHALWSANHRVVAPDHPGFAASDELPEVEGVDDLVFHYLDVIERLGLDRPALVGASFGGWLAAELAVAAPASFRAVALLSPVGLRIPEHPIADLFFLPPDQLPAALYADPARAALGAVPPDVDTLLALYRDQTALARYTWSPFMCNPKLHRRLGRIAAPTLVLWPEQDRVVPRAHVERYAELIPDAVLETIPDCGHASYLERPEAVAGAVERFLARVGEAGGAG
jgi:pimeloyl-ACP methyl ester carboxylesterase